MNIRLSIGSVDGKTEHAILTEKLEDVQGFLDVFDHEGSLLTFSIHASDEEAFAIIKSLLEQRTLANSAGSSSSSS
jgi:hypothetical protein